MDQEKLEKNKQSKNLREVEVSWEALEDAFENNAPEVHSYLHLNTGEVIRIVDGIADPIAHKKVMESPDYVRIEPVSSREQYRWMERFIDTVDRQELRQMLLETIDGKGAFRRFKDALIPLHDVREQWFGFRSERLRVNIEAWLSSKNLVAIEREEEPVSEPVNTDEQRITKEFDRDSYVHFSKAAYTETLRKRISELASLLPARELNNAVAFLEFLKERRPLPRPHNRASRESIPSRMMADSSIAKENGENESDERNTDYSAIEES